MKYNRLLVVSNTEKDELSALSSEEFRLSKSTTDDFYSDYNKKNHETDLILFCAVDNKEENIRFVTRVREGGAVPIIVLADSFCNADLQTLYEAGADACYTYEEPDKLIMSIKALIRRYRIYSVKPSFPNVLDDHGIYVEESERKVLRNGVDVGLTDTEYDIFCYFLSNRGIPREPKEIYEAVWHEEYLPTDSNTIMVHILNIRKKIEVDPTRPGVLKTVWGKGYKV